MVGCRLIALLASQQADNSIPLDYGTSVYDLIVDYTGNLIRLNKMKMEF